MNLPASTVLIVTYLIYVPGILTCPSNCRVVKKQSTCDQDGTCNNGCKPGYHGGTCSSKCDIQCRISACQQIDGTCDCNNGYKFYSGSCQLNKGVKCSSNEHCLNDTCISPGREDCLKGCNQGRYGSSCQHDCQGQCICDQDSGNCTECYTGWYGSECASQCSSGCKNNNCQRDGSCFQCNSGWYGGKCNVKCSRHCLSGCGQSNGDCIAGCKSGWYGDECNTKCSLHCLSECFQRNGSCTAGCKTGWHGGTCDIKCYEHCVSGCDQLTGDCVQCETGRYGSTCESECSSGCTACERDGSCPKGCSRGFYGDKCMEECNKCLIGICDQTTGACKGCASGFYGEFCNLACDSCTDSNCDGKCTVTREDESVVKYLVGGIVAVAVIITFAAGLVYICCRLKRIDGAIYKIVKFRRRPLPIPTQEGHDARPAGMCPIGAIRQTSYLNPGNHTSTGQPQLQVQTVGVSDQQAAQVAAAVPRIISGRMLHDALRRSDESLARPGSYMLPNYCELNEDLMLTLSKPVQGAEAPAPIPNNSSFSENETGYEIRIPLIGECFGTTETGDSSSDENSIPENYDHPFKDHYA